MPGRNGGTLRRGGINSGGKPGRSGRKKTDFIAWCQAVTDDETVRNVQLARAKSGDIKILEMAAHYAHGKPKEHTDISGEVKVIVSYDD